MHLFYNDGWENTEKKNEAFTLKYHYLSFGIGLYNSLKYIWNVIKYQTSVWIKFEEGSGKLEDYILFS